MPVMHEIECLCDARIEEAADKTHGVGLCFRVGSGVEKLRHSSRPDAIGIEEVFAQVGQCLLRAHVREQGAQ